MKKIYLVLLAVMAINLTQAQELFFENTLGQRNPSELKVFDNKLFFSADDDGADPAYGLELYVWDGTEGVDPTRITDIQAGAADGNPSRLFDMDGKLYFYGTTSGAGVTAFYDIYTTNGTLAGTERVSDGVNVMISGYFVPLFNQAYFIHADYSTGAPIFSLKYFSDMGDDQNLAQNITHVTAGDDYTLSKIGIHVNDGYNSTLLLGAELKVGGVGNELYSYDPSTGNFTLIKDIDPAGSSTPSYFTTLGTETYFEASGNLWVTDGEANGTTEAIAAASGLSGVMSLYAWDGKIFFEGDDGTNGDELYVYDPTANTVTQLSDISGGSNGNHDPGQFCPMGDVLYYKGEPNSSSSTYYLMKTDGVTEKGAELVDDTYPKPYYLTTFNDYLYYKSTSLVGDTEVVRYKPSPTAIGSDLNESSISIYPNPSHGSITINGLESGNAIYEIYNLSGNCVEKGNVSNGQQVNYTVGAGIYMVRITDGSNSTVQKIIVK